MPRHTPEGPTPSDPRPHPSAGRRRDTAHPLRRGIRIVLAASMLACGGEPGEAQTGDPGAIDWNGSYRVAFAGQTLGLRMDAGPDGVTGRLTGPTVEFLLQGEVETDSDGEVSVEGWMTGGGAEALFSFFPDEDGDFGLLVTPMDGDRPATERSTWYAVSRVADEDVADADVADESEAPAALATHPLVGTWTTQVMVGGEGGGIATQMAMAFRGDGTLVELGSRSMGGFPDGHIDVAGPGGGEQAAWRAQGNVLMVSYQGSPWFPLARFRIDGARLALTYVQDGSIQLWYRQGG